MTILAPMRGPSAGMQLEAFPNLLTSSSCTLPYRRRGRDDSPHASIMSDVTITFDCHASYDVQRPWWRTESVFGEGYRRE